MTRTLSCPDSPSRGGPSDPHDTIERYQRWITARWQLVLKDRLRAAEAAGDDARVQELRVRLETTTVVHPQEVMPGRVQFGSFVTVFAVEAQEERSFQIVSRDEADINRELLAATTPLAIALYGAQEGDEVTCTTPSGAECDYEVTYAGANRLPG